MLSAIPAAAQAGTVQFAAGDVTIDGQPVRVTPASFPSWNEGRTLRTGRARVEVLLAPAVFLRVGSQSSLRMESSSLTDTRIELRRGRAIVEVVDTVKGGQVAFEQGGTRTEFRGRGLFRFDADRRELQVYGGTAEVEAGVAHASAGRGREVQLDPSLAASKFSLKKVDALFQWAAQRSFYWFGATPEAWTRPSDWEITVTGWFWNPNFDMKFFSATVAARYRQMQAQQEAEKAASDRLKKYDP